MIERRRQAQNARENGVLAFGWSWLVGAVLPRRFLERLSGCLRGSGVLGPEDATGFELLLSGRVGASMVSEDGVVRL